jgi:hypothetical protein
MNKHQSPAAKRGLNFAVGARGLDSLSFNGQSFLDSPESGELRLDKSVLGAAIDALLSHTSSPIPTPNKQTDAVDLVYPWGRVSCTYGKQGDKMTMRIEASNAGTKEIDELSLPRKTICAPHDNTRATVWFSPGRKP